VSCAGVRVDLKRLAQFLHGEQLHPEVPFSVQENPVLQICNISYESVSPDANNYVRIRILPRFFGHLKYVVKQEP
jgi:hypothetical protein